MTIYLSYSTYRFPDPIPRLLATEISKSATLIFSSEVCEEFGAIFVQLDHLLHIYLFVLNEVLLTDVI